MTWRPKLSRVAAYGVNGCVIASTLILAGCYEHTLARRETMSVHGGNAVATNIILQTVNPWPPKAWDKQIDHDGTRMVNAIDAYHEPSGGSGVEDSMTSLTTDDGDNGSETTE